MNKVIIALVSVILATAVLSGAYLFVRSKPSNTPTQDGAVEQPDNRKQGEPKTEAFVRQLVQQYWEAAKFNDHRAKYRLLDNKLTAAISEDEYIRRQEWLDQHDLSGVVQIKNAVVGQVTLLDNQAEVRTTLEANTGSFSDITKLVYEDGEWHKIFESYDTLGIGKSFEEFVADNENN